MQSFLVRMCVIAFGVAGSTVAAQSPSVVEGRRQDLAVFRREFFDRDNSYSTEHRAEAEARLKSLESRPAALTAVQFELELARIVALADNGHTGSPAALRSPRYARVALRFVPFGDQFYVLGASSANADLLGGRLVAIDGKALAEVRAVAHTLTGGTPGWRDRQVPFFIESPEQMQAVGLASAPDAATYRLELPGGRIVERRVVADRPNGSRDVYPPYRWLTPEPIETDHGDWRFYGVAGKTPWAFQEPDQFFRLHAAPELNAIVVQLRANHDGPQSIHDFLDKATAEIQKAKPRNLVLDMRTNGGGDLNNTRDFAESLPKLVSGRVFVLTSPWTFSAAISTVGYLKQAGGDRVTIVGEMVGDRLQFWAEGKFVRLPYSGAGMSFATERHDYKTGCRGFNDCHSAVVRHPIAVNSLAPDVAAPLTIDAFVAGRDPGMEAIAKLLR